MLPSSPHNDERPSGSPFVFSQGDFWDRWIHLGAIKDYPAGSVIFKQGDHGSSFFYLLRGRVKISLFQAGGSEKILSLMETKSLFGESAALDQLPYFATAIALKDSRVCCFTPLAIRTAIAKDPDVAFQLITSIIRKQRLLAMQIENMTFLKAGARVAHILSRLAQDYGETTPYGRVIRLRLTHEEIAGVTGTSRVTVTKVLNDLKRQGILRSRRRELVIVDENKLLTLIG